MRTRFILAAALTLSLALQGCSSRPREFSPQLASPSADLPAFEAAYATCRQLLADGKLDSSGRLASGGVGAATGATTMAVGSAAAATVGGYGGLAVASLTVVALPFAVIGGAWGMAKRKKNKKERQIQEAIAGCLAERGYAVSGWERRKKDQAARVSHSD